MNRLPVRLDRGAPVAHRVRHRLVMDGWRGERFYSELLGRLGRRPPNPALIIGGSTLALPPDDEMAEHLYTGFYERPELQFFSRMLTAGSVVVDVGANVGVFSFLAAELVGPTGKVLSVEPSSPLASRLRGVIRSNGLNNVEVWEVAAGRAEGTAVLSTPVSAAGLGTLRSAGGAGHLVRSETVKVAPLSAMPLDGRIDFMKIDVEGWEAEALAGAEPLLEGRRVRTLMFEVTPSFGDLGYAVQLVSRMSATHVAAIIEPIRGRCRMRLGLHPVTARQVGSLAGQRNLCLVRKEDLNSFSGQLCGGGSRSCSLTRSGDLEL